MKKEQILRNLKFFKLKKKKNCLVFTEKVIFKDFQAFG